MHGGHALSAVCVKVALGLCALLLAVAGEAAFQTENPAQQTDSKFITGTISGHVLRSDTREPVAKAMVSLYPQDENTAKAAGGSRVMRTDPDGAFAFHDVPAGSYAIDAWRNGFAKRRIVWEPNSSRLSLKPGQKLEALILQLTPAGVISGTAYDEDQEAVASIAVELLRIKLLPGGRREIYLTASAPTDDQGNFRFAGLQPGTYYVRAGGMIQQPRLALALKEGPGGSMQYRDTYFPGTALLDEAQTVEARAGLETANIRMPMTTEKTYSITGAVVGMGRDDKLKPSELHIQKRSDAVQMWGIGQTLLNPDGSFTIQMLSPGEYTLAAVAIKRDYDDKIAKEIDEGFASVRIVDSDVRTEIQIGRAGEVLGNVEAPEGFSFAGKQIILESNGSGYYGADIDSKGKFDIRNVPPGEYTLSLLDRKSQTQLSYIKQAMCAGGDFATQPLELSLDVVLNCNITVADDSSTVSGRVTDSEKPAAGFVIVLIPQARVLRRTPCYTLTTNTDSSGRYRLAGVIPGDYFLFAVPPDDDRAYFALDYADRNPANARQVSVVARGMQVVDVKASKAQ